MIKINKPIIVEGRYDKSKLSSFLDATIITTDGFRIFSDKSKINLIKKLSVNGIIILTDSDTAGFKIRNYLKGCIDSKKITNIYIPDVAGKEKRKSEFSKEGKLGVEGIDKDTIINLFKEAGLIEENEDRNYGSKFTKVDMYNLGLSGKSESSLLRKKLIKKLNLPEHMSSNSLMQFLSYKYTYEEIEKLLIGED